jgi:23S rRNA-/tRNA-specific pseudouridylate synthase
MSGQIYVRHKFYPRKLLKLPIIHGDESCIALVKPTGISCGHGQDSILGQVRENLGKACLQNLGISYPDIAYTIDDAMSGILLLSKNRESANAMKNAYGSNLFEFTFDLFCEKFLPNRDSEMVCALPIARHKSDSSALISHKTGKKSNTTFRFIGNIGKYEHWQAICSYMRPDQICLHARESGLSILGDEVYGTAKIPAYSELKRNFKTSKNSGDKPYFGIMANLSTVKLQSGKIICGKLPEKMHTFLKFLANSWGNTKF